VPDHAGDEAADENAASDNTAGDNVTAEDTADDNAGDEGGISEEDAASALVDLQLEYDELNDRQLRLAAEFNNFRRRTEAERVELWGRAQAELLARLLDVMDDLQRVAGLDLTNASVEGIMEGIDLVEKKFLRVLDDTGAVVIDPVGAAFDPEIMEAMMRVPAESEDQDDMVDQVFLKGYTFKGNLVRPARVSVLKHG
jgi:molecular chaperone GrpE